MSLRSPAAFVILVLGVVLASGCSQGMEDLENYVAEVNARKGGRIEPLPEIQPYETFTYQAAGIRSPFRPDSPVTVDSAPMSGVRPDVSRNREFLEQFPLDTLEMVGTLEAGGQRFALVQDNEGLVHRVRPGNYIGQNDGKILAISESSVDLIEIISDGLGGYIERPAALALSD